MDDGIFKKMKVKASMTASILNAPPEYPELASFIHTSECKNDFTHLLVASKAEFYERFNKAADSVNEGGLFWISYPKSTRKHIYDINRDSLWHLVLPLGWHPVAQVSLNEEWSAVRLKRNEPGIDYEHPMNVKAKG